MQSPPSYHESEQLAAQVAVFAEESYEESLMRRFRAIAQRYEISDFFVNKLRQLEGYEIVVVVDDSGSMSTPLAEQSASAAYGRQQTRWDELRQRVGLIVDIGATMDKDGIDLFFLNRATLKNVSSSNQLDGVFATPPGGMTPISATLRAVLADKRQVMQEKKLLILIATDGQPTNARGDVDTDELYRILSQERDAMRCHVCILVCTDDANVVEYLNGWDTSLVNLDVVDDYASERAEVLAAQGPRFTFTQGNYIVKSLLGSIDPEIDRLDEKPRVTTRTHQQMSQFLPPAQFESTNETCCVVQ